MQVSSLNDLLACDKAVPASPLSWEVAGELADLFLVYLKSDPAPEKLSRLQYLLDINDATAEALQGRKDRATPKNVQRPESEHKLEAFQPLNRCSGLGALGPLCQFMDAPVFEWKDDVTISHRLSSNTRSGGLWSGGLDPKKRVPTVTNELGVVAYRVAAWTQKRGANRGQHSRDQRGCLDVGHCYDPISAKYEIG
ncbi:protein TIC110, chloroplastic [Tanacetum coccineum]